MPAERDILRWLAVAQQQRGNVRAALMAIMIEAMDEEVAVPLADLVMARLGPAARAATPPQQGHPDPVRQRLPDPTSPYRFVELNNVVIPAPEAVREPRLDLPLPGGFSGEIRVDWVVETPLLIGVAHGAGQQAEVVPLTLGAPGKFAIPGATLKGLLRAGVEIITLGRLSQLNRDHRFGLRDFGDDHYRLDQNKNPRLAWEKIGAGWLERREASRDERAEGLSDYCITPCDKRTIRIRALPKSWFPQGQSDGQRHLGWLGKELAQKYSQAGLRQGSYDFSPARAPRFIVRQEGDAVPAPDDSGTPGIYVFSGRLPLPRDMTAAQLDAEELNPVAGNKKKREYVFLEKVGAQPMRVPQSVFDAFELINSTPSGRGLVPVGSWRELQPVLAAGRRIPVFILGDLASPPYDFGLTRSFKVAHDRSVGDVLDAQTRNAHHLRRNMLPDWAEALFGSVVEEDDLLEPGKLRPRRLAGEALPPSALARKGRVAVGFAHATTPAALFPAASAAAITTTMMGPRASFAPHYLVGPAKHWSDTRAGLAGRKRYFPRFAGGSPTEAQAMVVSDHTLRPAQGEGTVSRLRFLVPGPGQNTIGFTGAIRVHNLLAEELGALLWVLTHGGELGGPWRHMIGRAKAFGAGQTRVANVRLDALRGHDAAADTLLHGPDPLRPFLEKFEVVMDQAVRTAGLPGRWKEQAQVRDWRDLGDPTWGQQQRLDNRARYPGAEPGIRDGMDGLDMANGPRAHTNLRRKLSINNSGPLRWLPTPRQTPRAR